MKALVLVAHGSRRQASNDEVRVFAQIIRDDMKDQFSIVEAGFLELAEPTIPEAIGQAVLQGAKEIMVVPYFLASGSHVFSDIPLEVEKARSQHEHVKMLILPHIGSSPAMKQLVRELAVSAMVPGQPD